MSIEYISDEQIFEIEETIMPEVLEMVVGFVKGVGK